MRIPALQQRKLRPFYLYRREDVSGVSGTGVVAVGVVLPSGRAVMEWCSRWPTITVFQSIDQIERIHGHGGRSLVGWGLPTHVSHSSPSAAPFGWTPWIKAADQLTRRMHGISHLLSRKPQEKTTRRPSTPTHSPRTHRTSHAR